MLHKNRKCPPVVYSQPRQIRSAIIRDREGSALIEFAFVSPLMVLFTLGIFEMGRMTMVKQILTNVSREGARMASLPNAESAIVQSQVQQLLTNSDIKGATVTLNPSSLSSAPAGSLVMVSISVPSESVSWLNVPLFMGGRTLSASTSMRRESL